MLKSGEVLDEMSSKSEFCFLCFFFSFPGKVFGFWENTFVLVLCAALASQSTPALHRPSPKTQILMRPAALSDLGVLRLLWWENQADDNSKR